MKSRNTKLPSKKGNPPAKKKIRPTEAKQAFLNKARLLVLN
jgi:hypothetical protein